MSNCLPSQTETIETLCFLLTQLHEQGLGLQEGVLPGLGYVLPRLDYDGPQPVLELMVDFRQSPGYKDLNQVKNALLKIPGFYRKPDNPDLLEFNYGSYTYRVNVCEEGFDVQ